jgi:hypothetical protein
MSENTTNKNVSSDEINLLDLFDRIGKTFKSWRISFVRGFLVSVVFLLKKWLPLGASIIAGIILAYVMKTSSPSIYTSDMILKSNVIENAEMIAYINRLQTLEKEAFSEAIYLPKESSENIVNLSAFWIIDLNKDKVPDFVDYKNDHNIYDTTNIRMEGRLDIRVTTKSHQDLNLVKEGIIKYIENNPLFQQRNNLRLSQNREMLNRLNLDIRQLDSLQKVKYFEETRKRSSQTGGQIVFMQEQNTQLLYNDIYSLYSRKQAIDVEMDVYKEIVTVISDFSIPSSRVNGLLFYLKKTVPSFFLVMLFFLIILANTRKIKEVYHKY